MPLLITHQSDCSCSSQVCKTNADLLNYFLKREFEQICPSDPDACLPTLAGLEQPFVNILTK